MRQRDRIGLQIPQVAEVDTPRLNDVAGECLLYYEFMINVFVSDTKLEERFVLRLLTE